MIPDIGTWHPRMVHFVVACLFLGLPLHLLAFLRKPRFFRPMATVLLAVGTVAAFAAVRSGTDAHGPAERIPDTRAVVVEHEELGERTRNLFAVALLLELSAVALAWRAGAAGASVLAVEAGERGAAAASTMRFAATTVHGVVAVLWIFGGFLLYHTAKHGGELVYEYAGGVGFRSGDTVGDVARLLRAGLYHQSRIDREADRPEAAARLVEELASRFPESVEVQFLAVESLLLDRRNGRAALEALGNINVEPTDERLILRRQLYAFDAFMLLQMPDSARSALDEVPERYRESGAVTQRRERLTG
jgi:uncharacterized membrane protein